MKEGTILVINPSFCLKTFNPIKPSQLEICCSGTVLEELWGLVWWNQRPENRVGLSGFFFFFLKGSLNHCGENKCGQFVCGLEKDNSQCSMFTLPPYWAAHEPLDMLVWCWMENKNPPTHTQQTERAGTERLEQRKRLEREEASTDGLCCD